MFREITWGCRMHLFFAETTTLPLPQLMHLHNELHLLPDLEHEHRMFRTQLCSPFLSALLAVDPHLHDKKLSIYFEKDKKKTPYLPYFQKGI